MLANLCETSLMCTDCRLGALSRCMFFSLACLLLENLTPYFIQAYTLVAVRLWFRLLHQRRSLTLSDLCLCVAAGVVLMVMIIFQKEHALGAMHRHFVPTPEVKQVHHEIALVEIKSDNSQLSFITILGYHTATYFTKFSILAFYSNLFPAGSPNLRKICYAVIAYTICCYATAMFLAIFWCGSKPNRNWAPGNTGCSLWDYTLFKTNFALNISSDLASETHWSSNYDRQVTNKY